MGKKQTKSKYIKLRISEDEYAEIKRIAQKFQGNMSYVLRIAVKQFDDDRARDRCTLVNEYIKYWQAHEVELRHIGGNINQATKRINEWSLTGHLTPERLEEYLSFLLPFREKIFQHITDLDTLSHQILRR